MLEIFGAFIGFILAIYAGIYIYFSYRHSYWSRKGVPVPDGWEFFWGHFKYLIKDDYLNVRQLMEWSKKCPKYFGILKGHSNVLVISDPDMVHEVLVKKFEYFHGREMHPMQDTPEENPDRVNIIFARGLHWKRLRTISNPIFSVSNLKKIMPTMVDTVDHVLDYMETICDKPLDIHKVFQELTMDVICRVAFGQQGCKIFKNPYIDSARHIFTAPVLQLTNTWIVRFPILKKLFKFKAKCFGDTFKVSEDLHVQLHSEIMERKKRKHEKKENIDFIDLFLEAEVDSQFCESEDNVLDKMNLKVSKELNVAEIVGQCFIFLLAGYDTTANSLSFLCYELINNPDALRQLQEEIDDFTISDSFTYESISKLRYLDACIKESLRLHPIAASVVNRRCMNSTTIGEVFVEKGTDVEIDVLTLNFSESLWGSEPEKFRPERWLESETRHQSAFLTFGAGPRICLGKRLALFEEKIMLIKLIQKFNLRKCDQSEKELFVRGYNVFYPASVTLKLDPRE